MSERATASSPLPVLPCGTPWPEDAIEVARVADAWGIKGGIKVQPFSKDPQALFGTKRWFLLPADLSKVAAPKPGASGSASPTAAAAAAARLKQPRLLRVKSAREQGDLVVAIIEDLDTRNDAESLKGARLFVSRTAFPTPAEDEFYWVDLIGLAVENREAQALGTVVDLLDTGAHCVLRCEWLDDAGQAQERLIPFVGAYIDRVSLADRRIFVDWGLDF